MYLMGKKELEIARIRNLDRVQLYDLSNIRHQGQHKQVMGLMVFYEDGLTLNYAQSDPEFSFLLRKVMDQYALEEHTRTISVDAATKAVLETGKASLRESMAESYVGQHALGDSLLPFARHRLRPVQDILYHQIRQIFRLQNETVNIEGYNGNRRKIALHIRVGRQGKRILPITLIRYGHFGCTLSVGNLFGSVHGLTMDIAFLRDRLTVDWSSPHRSMNAHCVYQVIPRGLHLEESLYMGGELNYQNVRLEEQEAPDTAKRLLRQYLDLDGPQPEGLRFYRLPWGCYLARGVHTQTLTRGFRESHSHNIYMVLQKDYVGLRHHGTNTLHMEGAGLHVQTDGLIKAVNLFRVQRCGVWEASFQGVPTAMGSYKKHLDGRTFYRLCRLAKPLDQRQDITLFPTLEEDSLDMGYKLANHQYLEEALYGREV